MVTRMRYFHWQSNVQWHSTFVW